MPLVGFLMDTTLAAATLVFSGVAERYPRIRWVLTHLGGAIPYLAERLDRGFERSRTAAPHSIVRRASISRQFYYDTVNFDPSRSSSRSISPAPIASSPAATTRIRSAASRR